MTRAAAVPLAFVALVGAGCVDLRRPPPLLTSRDAEAEWSGGVAGHPADGSPPERQDDAGDGAGAERPDDGADRGAGSDGANDGDAADATIVNGPGTALSFNGVLDFMRLERLVQNDFTLEAWVRPTSTGTGTQFYESAPIFFCEMPGVTNDFEVGVLQDKLAFGTGNPDLTIVSTSTITGQGWVHVAVTRQQASGSLAVYVDGVQEAQLTGANSAPLDRSPTMTIGNGSGPAYAGMIDEIRIWNIARAPAEIAAGARRLLRGDEPGLVAYFHLDEGAGGVARDATSGQHDAVVGAGTADSTPTWVLSDAPVTR